MAPTNLPISDTELIVLKVLWDLQPATVRQIQAGLKKQKHVWAYTTVQTLIGRLEQKEYVNADRSGRAHVFQAAVSREEFLSENLDDIAERVCEGEAVPLMMSLVKGHRFTAREIQQFRALLEEAEAERPARKGAGSRRKRRRES
jgi:predicted transcriptional regulator